MMISIKAEINIRLRKSFREPEIEGSDESFYSALDWPYKGPEQTDTSTTIAVGVKAFL